MIIPHDPWGRCAPGRLQIGRVAGFTSVQRPASDRKPAGGSPKGAERIAACWADSRKVPQVAFKPDFTRHAKAAPFKRNHQLLDVLPIGVVVFPGSGCLGTLAAHAMLDLPLLQLAPKARTGPALWSRSSWPPSGS